MSRDSGPRMHAGRRPRLMVVVFALWVFPAGPAEARAIRFERLSLEQGLSQGTVTCIVQDRHGFLWLGTQDGLNRFDGYHFERYQHDPTDPATLPADWIVALREDKSGNLWIGTEGGGLARWDGGDAFTRYRHDPEDPASLSGDRVRSLFVDRDGTLWVGTFESGLNRFDVVTGGFERFRQTAGNPGSLSSDSVRAITEDSRGRLWVGTLAGLNRFERSTQSFVRYRYDPGDPRTLSHDGVLSILEDSTGRLWIGTENGLSRLSDGAAGFVQLRHRPTDLTSLAHDRVRVLFEDRSGRLWIGTDGGLSLLEPRARSFLNYRHDPADASSLGADRVMSIFEDRGGLLWIGTQGGGVSKWNPATWSFSHYRAGGSEDVGLSSNTVYAFSEDDAGRLWIGTFGGGLDVLDRSSAGSGRFRHYRHDPDDPGSLGDDRVVSLLHDRRGALWVGTFGRGLSRFDPETGTFGHFRHRPEDRGSLSHDVVSPLLEDRQGRLWVGTFGGGLERLEDDGSFTHHRHDPEIPTSLSNDRITSLIEDAGGFLWIGTYGGGLDRLDSGGGFLRLQNDPARAASLSNDTVFALYIDPSGSLWVGTQLGLNRLERLDSAAGQASFQHYFERDGLPNDTIFGIQSDARGRLWLSTNRGLSRFDPSTGRFKSFNRNHGLQSDEFNYGAHYQSRSGELFFGGVEGFNAFFPEAIEPNPHVPPVVVTSFSRTGRPESLVRSREGVEEVSLGWRDYFFSFELAALDFAAPEENRYRYKLEGFDADWVDLGHHRQVTFTNLDAGRYVLKVQGSNNDGVWNERGTQVRISVVPPPWLTWWAYALYALALAAVVGGSVLHHHKKVARERAIARRERSVADRERAQAEEQRRMLAEREALIEELEAKNEELERFNYTVSHDLKSPLVTIKGFLGLLQKDAAAGDSENLERDVRRIAAATDRMGRLLEELLELSRVGRQVQPPEELHLGELAREALELIRGHAGDRAVDVSIDPQMPTAVGDRLRLLQLYQNLLGNALKYMGDQATPLVEVGCVSGEEAVELFAAEQGEAVLFVRDNGIGIDARYQDQVFGLFERLDAASEGTGVGLALAKRIVEMHGGRIWVESEGLGSGSCFCFTLPGAAPDGDEEPFREESQVIEAGHLFRKGVAGD